MRPEGSDAGANEKAGSNRYRPILIYADNLAVSAAAVTAATAVESAATTTAVESTTAAAAVEGAATVEASAAMTGKGVAVIGASATVSACTATIADSAAISVATASITIASTVAVSASVAITPAVETAMPVAAATVESMTPVAVIPRAGADEHTTDKPLRTIVSIRRARIWIGWIVTIGACGCRSHVGWSDSDPHCNLRLRVDCRKHQNSQ